MGELLFANDIHAVAQAKIDAARLTTASGNEKRGAISDLQRASQTLGNRRIMDAAGKQIGAISENIGRNLDAATVGTFSSRIAAAEELGSNVAMAAAAGVGGGSIEEYNRTLELHQAMTEESNARAVNSDNINASASRGATLQDAVGNMDNSVIRADLDFTRYVDHHKMGVFTRLATLGVAAVATYYGGPQAGSAVIGISEATQHASNGDYGAANNDLTGAIQNGIGAFKAYRAGAGQGEEGSPVMKDFWSSTKRIQANGSINLK